MCCVQDIIMSVLLAAIVLYLTQMAVVLSHPTFVHSEHNLTKGRHPDTGCLIYNISGFELKHHDDSDVKWNGQNFKNPNYYHTLGHCNYVNEVDYDPRRRPEYIPLRLCLTKCSTHKCGDFSGIAYYCKQIYKVHTVFINDKKEEKTFPSDCLCVSSNKTNYSWWRFDKICQKILQ